jgi:chromate reductase, NAD(P)H dehydrogenase (quinone)
MVSGSLRAASTNSAVLRTAAACAPPDVRPVLYAGRAGLPHFNPDDDADPLPAPVVELRGAVRRASAVLFCVPEYAGALPGSLKNLLDWLIGDDSPDSIYGKPVAWVNASPRGAVLAHDSLRAVLGYAHARIVEPACVPVPVGSGALDAEGLVADPAARAGIAAALHALLTSARADPA